ncbi:hypothetical protein BHM03_00054315 [Ensete ventricosum]|nr:hypothetical protein BHM03_00054315 [Ensete ventricosum]
MRHVFDIGGVSDLHLLILAVCRDATPHNKNKRDRRREIKQWSKCITPAASNPASSTACIPLKRVVVSTWKGGPTAKGGKERLGNGGVAVAAPESDESTGRGGYDLIALAGMRRQIGFGSKSNLCRFFIQSGFVRIEIAKGKLIIIY